MNSHIHLIRTQKGGIGLLVTVIFLPVCLAFAGLAIDFGHLYQVKRALQNAADAGATAGALSLTDGSSDDDAKSAASVDVGRNGFTHSPPTTTVVVNIPPQSGPHVGKSKHVEVIVTNETETQFLGPFGLASKIQTARAVAGAKASSNCAQTLGGGTTEIRFNGSPTATGWDNCFLSSAGAVTLNGNGTLNVDGIYYGTTFSQGQWNVNSDYPPTQRAAEPDPWSGLQPHFNTSQSSTSGWGDWCQTTWPTGSGRYRGGTLSAGVHCFPPGSFDPGNTAVNASAGVTLYIVDNVSLPNGSQLKAPSTGNTAGVALFGRGSFSLSTGSSSVSVFGTIYLPTGSFNMSGNQSISSPDNENGDKCFQVVSQGMTLNGTVEASFAGCTPSSVYTGNTIGNAYVAE